MARRRWLGRWQKGRMRWAIRIAERGDGLRIDLDPAAWRRQSVLVGIVAESAQGAAVVRLGGQRELAALPELFEIRRVPAGLRKRPSRRLVEISEPLPAVAPFREGLLDAELARKIGENVEIVARLADGVCDLPHGDQPRIGC